MVRDLASLFGRLFDDVLGVVRAEVQLAKSKLWARLQGAKIAILLAGGAIFLVQAALTACLVGLVMGMVPLIGPWLSALAILLAGLVLAGMLGWLAARQLAAPGKVAQAAAATVDAATEGED